MKSFTVTDWVNNIVINSNVKGKNCKEVLARYSRKEWIIRNNIQLEVTAN